MIGVEEIWSAGMTDFAWVISGYKYALIPVMFPQNADNPGEILPWSSEMGLSSGRDYTFLHGQE